MGPFQTTGRMAKFLFVREIGALGMYRPGTSVSTTPKMAERNSFREFSE
jgi:hypothetical protein